MINQSEMINKNLQLEIMLTARVLTHKLQEWITPVNIHSSYYGSERYINSSLQETIGERYVPEFPINELSEILNCLNNQVILNHKVSNYCVETGSGIWQTTEARTYADNEEEKETISGLCTKSYSLRKESFEIIDKTNSSGNMPIMLVPKSPVNVRKLERAQKYEKKNIFYKAVFRDIRRYFIELLKQSSTFVQFENNITGLLRTGNKKLSDEEIKSMVSILAPFLNYNKYLIEWDKKNIKDAQWIIDWQQNFTLTKMRKVLQYPGIKFIVKYYYENTVKDGVSERLRTHKTMRNNPSKYLEVLRKIVQISETY